MSSNIGDSKTYQAPHQVTVHDVSELVDVHDRRDDAIMDVDLGIAHDNLDHKEVVVNNGTLRTFKASQKTDSVGDIRQVHEKEKDRKKNKCQLIQGMVHFGDMFFLESERNPHPFPRGGGTTSN